MYFCLLFTEYIYFFNKALKHYWIVSLTNIYPATKLHQRVSRTTSLVPGEVFDII